MIEQFFEKPILNSPYEYPAKHWELDGGQPTNRVIATRRSAEFISPIPKPKKQRRKDEQKSLALGDLPGISTDTQTYNLSAYINSVRA